MPWTFMDVPEAVDKLTPEQKQIWVRIANEALAEGYDETRSIAVAWSVVNTVKAEDGYYPAIYWRYPLLRPGHYVPASGPEFDVDAAGVAEMAEALNLRYSKGQPCSLIMGHDSDTTQGVIAATLADGDVCSAALVYMPWFDSGLRTGAYGLSMEAVQNYASEAYTDGRTFKLWPTAWAILPAGEQPACPPGQPLAAREQNGKTIRLATVTAPIRGSEPQGKEAGVMEELTKQIAALTASVGDLTAKVGVLEAAEKELKDKLQAAEKENADLKAAAETATLAAREKSATEREEKILAAELKPGNREKIQERIKAAADITARETLLDAYEATMIDLGIPMPTLEAGERKPDEQTKTPADLLVDEAKKIQASEKCSWNEALNKASRKGSE